jgi:hypothetical protein
MSTRAGAGWVRMRRVAEMPSSPGLRTSIRSTSTWTCWIGTGIYYALADAAGRQQATGGIVALFSLNTSVTYVDGFVAGLAILALSLLQFGPHALPRPLIWLGALTGVYHIVSGPIQLAISHSPAGATGPIGVVLLLVWILAVAAVMLIKPVRSAEAQPAGLISEASLVS